MANGIFKGGDGSKTSPYLIEDAKDFNNIRLNMTAFYKLVNSIDLAEYDNFSVIGSSAQAFEGELDGNQNKVRNLRMTSGDFKALFFDVGVSGKVKNIVFEDCSLVNVGSYSAVICSILRGSIERIRIVNSFVTGSPSSKFLGGAVSRTTSTSVMKDIHFEGNVTGGGDVGGVASNLAGKAIHCSSRGSVTATTDHSVGGFCSALSANSEARSCFSLSNVSLNGVGKVYCGGFAGNIGGSVRNCYSRGNVTSSGNYVGGFSGSQGGSSNEAGASTSNCYSSGKVTASGSNVGSFIGSRQKGSISNNFFDSSTSNVVTSLSGVTPLNNTEMKKASNFIAAGWGNERLEDERNVWVLNEGEYMTLNEAVYIQNKYLFKDGEEIKKYGVGVTPIEYSQDLTSPGAAISAGTLTNYVLGAAFDNDLVSSWVSSQNGTNMTNVAYIGQRFDQEREIRKITIQKFNNKDANIPKAKVQRSSDGVVWQDVFEMIFNGLYNDKQEFLIPPSGKSKYWRILATSSVGNSEYLNWALKEIEMMEGVVFSKEWVELGVISSKELFDLHGMSDLSLITNEAIQQLQSDQVELLCWTDEQVEKSSTSVEPTSNVKTANGQINSFAMNQEDYYHSIVSITKGSAS